MTEIRRGEFSMDCVNEPELNEAGLVRRTYVRNY